MITLEKVYSHLVLQNNGSLRPGPNMVPTLKRWRARAPYIIRIQDLAYHGIRNIAEHEDVARTPNSDTIEDVLIFQLVGLFPGKLSDMLIPHESASCCANFGKGHEGNGLVVAEERIFPGIDSPSNESLAPGPAGEKVSAVYRSLSYSVAFVPSNSVV
jgi:hypothetical protein